MTGLTRSSRLIVIGLLLVVIGQALGFSPPTTRGWQRLRAAVVLRVSREVMEVPLAQEGEDEPKMSAKTVFRGAEFLTIALSEHRPLGCTVEESLAGQRHVFVSKVTAEGFAERAGLKEGDVVVGISGLFGDMENVMTQGIDKV